MSIIYKQESFNIVGACFEVYNEMGSGFDEPLYHESLELEFAARAIPYISKSRLEVRYKGHILKKNFRPDIIAYSKIILELKAVKELNDDHRRQVHNYLKATGFKLGILVNFCNPTKLEYERIVNTKNDPPPNLQG
ncbi:MAG: GxxExxY protein [Akkermansiaceae bacterium]|nr:GxxExxY protein [Akkermansiaceae bacterium]